jgi:hypothetical protein
MLRKTLLTLFFLAGIAPLFSGAQAPVPGQLPAQITSEKPAPPAQDYSREAFTIERYSTRISAENDGTGTREITAELKMLAEAGVKAFAVLNFTYSSANEPRREPRLTMG